MARRSDSTSSTDASAELRAPVSVGQVLGAHGMRGEVRLRLDVDDAGVLAVGETVTLASEGRFALPTTLEIASVAAGRSGELRVAFRGVASRDEAAALAGRAVRVARERLAPLPEGEYYGFELVGCRVEDGEGRPLGTIRDIWSTGAPDVLVIEDEAGREQLVPSPLLREVDVASRRVVVEVLPGLLAEVDSDGAEPPGGDEECQP